MNDLEIDDIEVGMIKCCNQATQLYHDAELLFENKRFTTAYSIYQLASEESSKIKILLRLAVEKRSGMNQLDDARGKYFSNLFKSHLDKIKLATVTDQNLNDLAKRLDIPTFRDENKIIEDIKNPRRPDLLKQDGIYVSVKEGKFVSPSEVITEQNCKEMRELVFNRHSSMKGTMQEYLNYTEFYVQKFVDDILEEQKNQKK